MKIGKYFDSSLSNTKCPDDDYNYAQEVYKYFDCKEITDYNDLYVKTCIIISRCVYFIQKKYA